MSLFGLGHCAKGQPREFTAPMKFYTHIVTCRFCGQKMDCVFIDYEQVENENGGFDSYRLNPQAFAHPSCVIAFEKGLSRLRV